MLDDLRAVYDVVPLDVSDRNREGRKVDGVRVVDLIDPDRSQYERHFEGVDTVIHLAHRSREGDPIDHFFIEKQNVEMAYNVLRCAYDGGVRRVVVATSNHAADWYEHNLIHSRMMDVVHPYDFPLSDNFYGWAKSSQEVMGFLFACGFPSFDHPSGREILVEGINVGRKLEVVMVRIGHPRELDPERYGNDPATFKRVLGCYWSVRDQIQLFTKAYRDSEHRERTRRPIPHHLWHQQQHSRVLVAQQRSKRLRVPAGGRFRGAFRPHHQGLDYRR